MYIKKETIETTTTNKKPNDGKKQKSVRVKLIDNV